MSTKATPKSCSCYQCRNSSCKRDIEKAEQRAARRKEKQALKKHDLDNVMPAPYGDYKA